MTKNYQEMLSVGLGWCYERSSKALTNVIAARQNTEQHAKASAELTEISRLGGLFTGETEDARHSSSDRETALCNSIDDDEALFRLEAHLLSGRTGVVDANADSWFIKRVKRDLEQIEGILAGHSCPPE